MNYIKKAGRKMANAGERRQRRKRSRRVTATIGICVVVILCVGALVVGGKSKGIFNTLFTDKTSAAGVDNSEKKPEPKPEPKPTDIVKGSNTTYEGEKYGVPASEVSLMVHGKYEGEGKRVFLTFDDGPSPNTDKVLKTLEEKGVHGTFFVVGQMLEKREASKEALKTTIKNGNAIANHSYTHDLKKLYPKRTTNIDAFMDEYNKTNNLMKTILGDDFDTKVLRMPGGYMSRVHYKDPNLPKLNEAFKEKGIVSIDWNALNGDAEGKPYTEEQMLDYVKRSSKNKNNVIVLMHDTYGKQKTANMLPKIIDYFKENGYEFKTIKNG